MLYEIDLAYNQQKFYVALHRLVLHQNVLSVRSVTAKMQVSQDFVWTDFRQGFDKAVYQPLFYEGCTCSNTQGGPFCTLGGSCLLNETSSNASFSI